VTTPAGSSDFESHNSLVCELFDFLCSEFGFEAPERDDSSTRYRQVAFSRPNLCLEFAIEPDAPDRPWWTAVRLFHYARPSSYGTDEEGRIRRLYRHQIVRAIQPHLSMPVPQAHEDSLRGRLEYSADFLRRYARWFLLHSDEVFDVLDHPPPKQRKLP